MHESSSIMASQDPIHIGNFDSPILITGCARSRTSMVAGVINRCGVWGGDMFLSAPGNTLGFYENKDLREKLTKPLLRSWGVDPLGVYPLPENREGFGRHIYQTALKLILDQGYDGQSWFYKGAKMAYFWKSWHEAFPNAKWVIVRRDKEEIIDSCLRTHFMNQHSHERAFWERWVDETEKRLEELKKYVDYIEVWPPENLQEMVSDLGLEWTEEADIFISEPFKKSEPIVEITTGNPVPSEVIQRSIIENLKRDVKHVFPKPQRDDPLIIVGGGPSLKKNLDNLRKQKGKILAVNGAHDYLVSKGIKPWGMIMLDPRSDMGKFCNNPQEGVKYFIASQCPGEVFEKLKGYDVFLWHAHVGAGEQEVLETWGGDWVLIGGGSTCGLRAFHLGMLLGFHRLYAYGMDSCLDELEHHAYEQDIRKSGLEQVVKVHTPGKEFMATAWMYAQAQDFNKLLAYHGDKFTITFRGGGLLSHIASQHPNRRAS